MSVREGKADLASARIEDLDGGAEGVSSSV
jgi:hypothetical protein